MNTDDTDDTDDDHRQSAERGRKGSNAAWYVGAALLLLLIAAIRCVATTAHEITENVAEDVGHEAGSAVDHGAEELLRALSTVK